MKRRHFLMATAALGPNPMSAMRRGVITLDQWLRANPEARKRARDASLRLIRDLDPSVQAWVQVDSQPQISDGPLAGIPFGVKDVIEAENLVNELGSPIYKGQRSKGDAGIVRKFRNLGAIVLGKTHTAAFAHTGPGPTRNPRNIEHTPGGSSSGSAAAVAAGMAPFAIGTQTGGSVLRPASFCGITGFKPTFGLLPVDGVLEYARNLDTIGLFTHTAFDMLQLWNAMGLLRGRDERVGVGFVDPLPPGVEAPMEAAVRDAVSRLRRRGVDVRPVAVAALIDQLTVEALVIQHYEGARAHDRRYQEHGARLGDVAKMVAEGRQIPESRYVAARAAVEESRRTLEQVYATTPVVLVPAATGPAPRGLSSTGDSRMNRPWTALGTPAISLPMRVKSGLPLGLQLTAAPGQDSLLLRAAVRVAALL